MLPADEETLVLTRAVRHGELTEAEIPPDTASAPAAETLRFGRRLDRLITRGRISEQRVLQILREIRAESIATGPTILPHGDQLRFDLGVGETMLPSAHSDSIVSSARTPSPIFDAVDGSGMMRTADGSQVGHKVAPSSNKFPVERWERYEFLTLLGQGGMGAVYKAKDKRLGRLVALKFIRGSDDQMTHRFMQEARAQSRLDHPSICHVFEVGEVEGKAYIAMQFVDGEALDKAQASMGVSTKVQVMRDVSLAMHHAHEKGIIHRDIKPAQLPSRNENGTDWGKRREKRGMIQHPRLDVNLFDTLSELPSEIRPTVGDSPLRLVTIGWGGIQLGVLRTDYARKRCDLDGFCIFTSLSIENSDLTT